jgi:hypothetical protein
MIQLLQDAFYKLLGDVLVAALAVILLPLVLYAIGGVVDLLRGLGKRR